MKLSLARLVVTQGEGLAARQWLQRSSSCVACVVNLSRTKRDEFSWPTSPAQKLRVKGNGSDYVAQQLLHFRSLLARWRICMRRHIVLTKCDPINIVDV